MKVKKILIRIYAVSVFITVLLCALSFSSRNIIKNNAKISNDFIALEQNDMDSVKYSNDDESPAGKKATYKFRMNAKKGDNCLVVYFIHQKSKVYIGNKLKFSEEIKPNTGFDKTTGSYWATITLTPKEYNSVVTIESYPYYNSVLKTFPPVYYGNELAIFKNLLLHDLPSIILSLMSACIGISFIILTVVNAIKNKRSFYPCTLGIFSLFIGIWEFSYVRITSLFFPKYVRFIANVSFSTLILLCVPLLLFIIFYLNSKLKILPYISIAYSNIIAISACILQITGIFDFRELLYFIHSSIIIDLISIIAVIIHAVIKDIHNPKVIITALTLIACTIGAFIDMILYYKHINSSQFIYSLSIFVIFVLITGGMSNFELNKQAYIDSHTGLYNKSRCNQVFTKSKLDFPAYVFMCDLNYLKRVNDNYGHEAGDNLIFAFADCIRRSIPAGSFAGRFGGDEFVVILNTDSKSKADKFRNTLIENTEKYNAANPKVPINFSIGCSYSGDYHDISLFDLLEEADKKMYIMKKEYHNLHDNDMKQKYSI